MTALADALVAAQARTVAALAKQYVRSGMERGTVWSRVEFHHVVSREDGGDDVADNIVPLCSLCHRQLTARAAHPLDAGSLLTSLSDAEYAYAEAKGGPGYFRRAYGIEYQR